MRVADRPHSAGHGAGVRDHAEARFCAAGIRQPDPTAASIGRPSFSSRADLLGSQPEQAVVQDLIIRAMAMPPLDTLTYLVACPDSRQGVVIDPAGGPERILAAIAELKLQIAFILNTHGHADHVSGNRLLKERLGAPVGMHAADVRFFSDAAVRRQLSRQLELPPRDPVDMRLRDGDVLKIGRRRIRVLHTPGHTPGSVCFWIDGHLFTGDTLFVGAVGRTDLPGGSLKRLVDSLACKIIGLPAETVVWPGHDYGETPFSTIGRERIENPYITDFILDREY